MRKPRAISRAGPRVGVAPTHPRPKNGKTPHPHEKIPKYLVLNQKIRKNGEYRGGKQKWTTFYGKILEHAVCTSLFVALMLKID